MNNEQFPIDWSAWRKALKDVAERYSEKHAEIILSVLADQNARVMLFELHKKYRLNKEEQFKERSPNLLTLARAGDMEKVTAQDFSPGVERDVYNTIIKFRKLPAAWTRFFVELVQGYDLGYITLMSVPLNTKGEFSFRGLFGFKQKEMRLPINTQQDGSFYVKCGDTTLEFNPSSNAIFWREGAHHSADEKKELMPYYRAWKKLLDRGKVGKTSKKSDFIFMNTAILECYEKGIKDVESMSDEIEHMAKEEGKLTIGKKKGSPYTDDAIDSRADRLGIRLSGIKKPENMKNK